MEKAYYEAYDDRYCQVHEQGLQWTSNAHTEIVETILVDYPVPASAKILEIGCGEGRDAVHMLEKGYNLLATDVSPEAIRYCREAAPKWADRFSVLDCLRDEREEQFDFIYAVAVLHMLVRDADRSGFYRFFAKHLTEQGIGLVCSMGDGSFEICSDIAQAFVPQRRTHGESGREMMIAGTSCRVVTWEQFLREPEENGLQVIRHGITAVEPDFPEMMYAVVRKI